MIREDFTECQGCFRISVHGDTCHCQNRKAKVIELTGVSSYGEGPYRIDDILAQALHEVKGKNVVITIRD